MQRAQAMLQLAPSALADIELPDKPGFSRRLQRVPLGGCVMFSYGKIILGAIGANDFVSKYENCKRF